MPEDKIAKLIYKPFIVLGIILLVVIALSALVGW